MNRAFALLALIALPAFASAAPTTFPSNPPTVMIFPFKQMGDPTAHPWIGGGINENLLSEASRDPAVITRVAEKPMANSDSNDALRFARDKGASVAVFGSYEVANDQLRVNGQIVDVNSEHHIGDLKASGQIRDLFNIEDSLAAQLKSALPQPTENLPAVSYGSPNQQMAYTADNNSSQAIYPYQQQAASPDTQTTTASPTYVYPYNNDVPYVATNSYPDYGYGYDYPYSYYGWGGYPFVIYGGGFGYGRYGGYGGFHGGYGGGFRGGVGFRGGASFGAAHSFGGGHFGGGGHR
jgi:TolB-like protein